MILSDWPASSGINESGKLPSRIMRWPVC